MPDNIYIGSSISDLDISPIQAPLTTIVCDCGNSNTITVSTSGESSSSMNITCEWGTEETVAAMLDSLAGFVYQPLEASGAIINPAFEVGDAIMVRGYYSGLWNVTATYGPVLTVDISAPTEEMDHEYPVPTSDDKYASKRALAQGKVSVGGGGLVGGSVAKSALTSGLQDDITKSKQAYEALYGGAYIGHINAGTIDAVQALRVNDMLYVKDYLFSVGHYVKDTNGRTIMVLAAGG